MVRTVLVVDDDPDTLDYLELAISLKGVHVVASDYTGDVAGLIRETQPDVVLLDLQNGNDHRAGLDILEQLRADAVTVAIPVLLMTSDHAGLTRHAERLREYHAHPLPKGFDLELVWARIEQVAA